MELQFFPACCDVFQAEHRNYCAKEVGLGETLVWHAANPSSNPQHHRGFPQTTPQSQEEASAPPPHKAPPLRKSHGPSLEGGNTERSCEIPRQFGGFLKQRGEGKHPFDFF